MLVEIKEMKTCSICKIEKKIDEFSPISMKPGKTHPYCTPCRTDKAKKAWVAKRKAQVYVSRKVS